MTLVAPDRRGAAVRRATRLNRLSLGYNAVEAVIAIGAGVVAGSISLVGFGLDSVVEVSASLILAWRLAAERRGGCTQEADRRATKAVALSFGALAIYVGFEATQRLRVEGFQRPWVIALTAGVGTADRELARHAGMDDYLVKPLRNESLQAALSRAYQEFKSNPNRGNAVGI